jgi:DNA-directed RNA polymerase specialized sigma24 family protein
VENNIEKTIDMQLILKSLEEQDPESAEILKIYAKGYNIKEICKRLKISRFKVKRRLDKGLDFIRAIAEKEGILEVSRKYRRR